MAGEGGVVSYARVLPVAFAVAIAATLLGVTSYLVNDTVRLTGANPTRSTTPGPACATRPAGCPPAPQVTLTGVREGAVLRGIVRITASPAHATPSGVIFTLGGARKASMLVELPPYRFRVQGDVWDTRAVPDGTYTLTISAGDPPVQLGQVHFRVRNGTR